MALEMVHKEKIRCHRYMTILRSVPKLSFIVDFFFVSVCNSQPPGYADFSAPIWQGT